MTPMGPSASLVSGSVLLSGVWKPNLGSRRDSSVYRWYATLLPYPDGSWARISSFRVKALSNADHGLAGFEFGELQHAFRDLGGQIETAYAEHRRRKADRGISDVGDLSWLTQLPEIEQRLDILKAEHLRSKKSGELADASATFTIGEVSALCQLPQRKIRDLEQFGLISPARSEGGQRRYTASEISKIKDLAEALNSGRSYEELSSVDAINPYEDSVDAAMSVSGSKSGLRRTGGLGMSHSQIQDWTMRTVAELYLDACEKFPRRDQSVIEYIRSHMPWLTTNYVITLIRRARREGIELPIYRRGRLPKGSLAFDYEGKSQE